jgi:hypothetical protein
MELESLKRQIQFMKNNNVKIKELITDRHTQVSAYMASENPDVQHTYDVWHVAKGEQKLTELNGLFQI